MPAMRYWALLVLLTPMHAAAGPPVTDPTVPSPAAAAARMWAMSGFQLPYLDFLGEAYPRSEASRMLAVVQHGEQLGAGIGWYSASGRRHDWAWFANRFDRDRDGRISRAELS